MTGTNSWNAVLHSFSLVYSLILDKNKLYTVNVVKLNPLLANFYEYEKGYNPEGD